MDTQPGRNSPLRDARHQYADRAIFGGGAVEKLAGLVTLLGQLDTIGEHSTPSKLSLKVDGVTVAVQANDAARIALLALRGSDEGSSCGPDDRRGERRWPAAESVEALRTLQDR